METYTADDDKYGDKYYIDCEYCAEGIHMDEYPKHLCNCRILCNKQLTATTDYEEYYKQQQAHDQEIKQILSNVTRERLLLTDSLNWRYESFERFIRERINTQLLDISINNYHDFGGLHDLENAKYSKLFYIWSISGAFNCDICMFDKFTFYRKLACSHKICNSCYHEWFKTNTTCPFCRFDFNLI
jgi:hypothetical protein